MDKANNKCVRKKVVNVFLLRVTLQWGSEIQLYKINKYLKSGLSDDWISHGPVFKRPGLGYCLNQSKLIQNPDIFLLISMECYATLEGK